MSELTEKLLAVQSELKAPKGQYNSFGKYSYRSCEDILEALKPLLKEHGLALTLTDKIVLVGGRYYVKATATVVDGDASISIDAYARESETKKGMDESQITGTASSYARKYALNGLFLIDDQKDDDTREPTDEKQPAKMKAPKKDGLADAKARLWEAVKAYSEKNNSDPKKVAAGVEKRPDYVATQEFFVSVAEEFESEL